LKMKSRDPEKGYNISPGGDGGWGKGKNHPQYGTHRSEETKEKLRKAFTGIHPSEETRKKLSLIGKGKKKPSVSRKMKLNWKDPKFRKMMSLARGGSCGR